MSVRKLYGEDKYGVKCPWCNKLLRTFETREEAAVVDLVLVEEHTCDDCEAGHMEEVTEEPEPHSGWELVEDEHENFNTYRMAVPEGWLVLVDGVLTHQVGVAKEACEEATHQLAITVTKDPNHTWQLPPQEDEDDGEEE